ncbi:uncharacterized protein PF3D7_1120000-like [Clytia hemisphaerica]|uniref:Uncharacterized protein n=1 Tax=Clytia hemisphaerica TaxID=252671 RepID=A0A7M5WRS0_9CNID
MEKWELVRAVVMTKPHQRQQQRKNQKGGGGKKKSKNLKKKKKSDKKDGDKGMTSSVHRAENEIRDALEHERERYKKKLNKAKQTAELTEMLNQLSEHQERKKQLVREITSNELPIIHEIQKRNSVQDTVVHVYELRKQQGNAMLRVRKQRAAMDRVEAQNNAAIEKLNSKLKQRRAEKDFKLPLIEKRMSRADLFTQISRQVGSKKTSPDTKGVTKDLKNILRRQSSQEPVTRKISTINVYSDPKVTKLLRRMDSNLEKINESAEAKLKERTEELQRELKTIEESIRRELSAIKVKQKQELRIQKMRIAYREMVAELRRKDEFKKRQFERLERLYNKRRVERDMEFLTFNQRLSTRQFTYFSR